MYHPMDVDDVPAASGSRPDRLSAVSGPHELVQRHTVEQIGDAVSPTLDVLVPLREEQLVPAVLALRFPCSRAGYRGAQDLVAIPRVSYGSV